MLTIAKLGVGQESYYLGKVASGVEDYYSGQGESPGGWLGRGALRLRLDGAVAAEQLRALMAGIDPSSGERLVGREGAKRVPGWDLTFSAPKSVSVLYGLGGFAIAEQVVAAHGAAVEAGLAYLERHATVTRQETDGQVAWVRGQGLVVAAFRHRTSRAGDPQLHTHALAVNVVERINGGWRALHSPVIYRHARTAGFVYQAVLRGELTDRLGVAWGSVHNGYAEIAGVEERLIEAFSKRRTDIEAVLAERGEDSARAAQVAAHATRTTKEYGVDPETLRQRWAVEARAVGVDPASLAAAIAGWPQVEVTTEHLEGAIAEMTSATGLTAHHASFDHRDVVRAWCVALPPGTKVSLDDLEALVDGLLADRDVVPIIDGNRTVPGHLVVRDANGHMTTAAAVERRWSTTEMLAIEEHLLNVAVTRQADASGQVADQHVEEYLRGRTDLTGEQISMVRSLTTSGDGVEVVVGRAGTGKTYALAAAADVWRSAGYRPVGLALAARAAHELEVSAGIPSATAAQFLIDVEQAPPGMFCGRHVLVVDEAGMVDTRRLARLVAHAHHAGAKIVLVGDHHQLPAVEAGGAFAALVDRIGAIELTENRRQVELWEQDTLARLRTGEGGKSGIAEVVDIYDLRGRIHLAATPADARAAMVADWYEQHRAGMKVGMIALRRADVRELNHRARALLVADGAVHDDGITVGDRTFGAGDRVVCLHNDRRIRVHNALFANVVDTDRLSGTVTIQLDNSRRIAIPVDYLKAGHLDHAYATTIHKVQGATYDRSFLLGDDHLYRQASYTALSRGSERNDLYIVDTDDRESVTEQHGVTLTDEPLTRLIRALHRDGGQMLAATEQHIGLAGLPDGRDTALASVNELDALINYRTPIAGRAAEIEFIGS